MTQYYKDVSHGKLLVRGTVMGWYTLPKNDTYYENAANGDGPPFGEFLTFGLEQADANTDFGQFDNDGQDGLPNSGDDDGYVDAVFFIHPEIGAECQGGAAANIWSHSSHYSYETYGHSGPFVTNDPRLDADGNPLLNADGSPQMVLVDDYTIQPALSCSSTVANPRIVEIGVFCHEYGHALGLPDLYDRTPHGDPDSEGVGNWCLMAGGSYGGDGSHADVPAHMSAWCKQYLGWASVRTIDEGNRYAFEPVEDRGQIYRIGIPNTDGKEFFLLEWRDRDWEDQVYFAKLNWDAHLPTSGLAVWHVDERVGAQHPDWPFAPRNQGQNDAPSIPGATKHALVALEQADLQQHLEQASNRGDADDTWAPASLFGDHQLAGARSYVGTDTGVRIGDIDLEHQTFVVAVEAAPTDATARPNRLREASPVVSDAGPVVRLELQPAAAAREDVVLAPILAGIRRSEAEELPADSREALRSAPRAAIQPGLTGDQNLYVQRELASERRSAVRIDTVTSNRAEQEVKRVLTSQDVPGATVTVQVTPDGERVERITGLGLARESTSARADAQRLIDTTLRPLIGSDVELAGPAPGPSRADTLQRFQQIVQKDGQSLPLWGHEVDLYYDKNQRNLIAMTNSTLPTASVKVTGRAGVLTVAQAKSVIQQQLGLSPAAGDLIVDCQEGVYVLNDDLDRGRVAYRVCISAGSKQAPLHVYLDSTTREVLAID